MAGAVATLDLASVTDALVAGIDGACQHSPLWSPSVPKFAIAVSGNQPDVVRDLDGCQLSLSLLHVIPDATWRNRSVHGAGGIETPTQPIALVLRYLLTAFAGKNAIQEQQAMSIALTWVAANPIHQIIAEVVQPPAPQPPPPPRSIHITLTIEPASLDEISRLWQSLGGPLRLCALLRVGVVFLGIDPELADPPAHPTKVGVWVVPKPPPLPVPPEIER